MRLLITDLDNTLYDWVTYFANAFQAMVKSLSATLDIEEERLLDDFKAVHQRYGNSEQPFAVLELPSVIEKLSGLSRAEMLNALRVPLAAFNEARAAHLRLYPGVLETLQELSARGVIVVGHTEAIAVNAYSRLRSLGIARYFHHIYALEGRLEPHPDPNRDARHGPPAGLLSLLPFSERKPNPALLIDVCNKEGVPLGAACYVGDSLTRDVSMAKMAGVTAVWARYGTAYEREVWNILVRVTHWTDEDVRREGELRTIYEHVRPDYTIDSFSDILNILPAENAHMNVRLKAV